jgi:hypothetical protein
MWSNLNMYQGTIYDTDKWLKKIERNVDSSDRRVMYTDIHLYNLCIWTDVMQLLY